ncbi:hypothetical protein [Bacillus sp. UNC41MFS5]|uniref:hypothetical protein n=1 Tax=Bacillus sp. UNC41MFS5 TaxID=1449046 RepID=UPI000AE0ACA7|nr:hypothetical protein [Bacillus sp. UNC41MFS5]
MCGSNHNKRNCCPDAQILQEEICGNLTGPIGIGPDFPAPFAVWTAPTTGGK